MLPGCEEHCQIFENKSTNLFQDIHFWISARLYVRILAGSASQSNSRPLLVKHSCTKSYIWNLLGAPKYMLGVETSYRSYNFFIRIWQQKSFDSRCIWKAWNFDKIHWSLSRSIYTMNFERLKKFVWLNKYGCDVSHTHNLLN